jgi:hypothetical protein
MTENGDTHARSRSSDSPTPKPPSKVLKMAEGDGDFGTKIIDQMTVIADAVS